MFDLNQIFGVNVKRVDEIIADMSSHIREFRVPKKDGTFRVITAPDDELKLIQKTLLDTFFKYYTPHFACHGFVKGRSVSTNAHPHVGARFILNVDIKDFFNSINVGHLKNILFGNRRVCKMCSHCGSNCSPSLYENLNNDFEFQCPEILSVYQDGYEDEFEYQSLIRRVIGITTFKNATPQGFPTSPVISNLVLRVFDRRFVERFPNISYTRYADDITMSLSQHRTVTSELRKSTTKDLLVFVNKELGKNGFVLKRDKTRSVGQARRMEVTGVTVNSKESLGRKKLMNLRAHVNNIVTGKSTCSKHEAMVLKGHLAYMCMVNPLAKRYMKRFCIWHGYNKAKLT